MRREILFNDDWRFYKGDIIVNRPIDKGPVYSQCKVERKKIGPAAYSYDDLPDDYRDGYEIKSEGWEFCELLHNYIINQDNYKTQNNAHGYFKYNNAWYRKHFTLPEGCENKHILLRFDGVTGIAVLENIAKYKMQFIKDMGANGYRTSHYHQTGALDLFFQRKGAFYQNKSGNVVPDAAEFVKFSVNEPARIIGIGSDHCDHNNVTLRERKMYMGKIRIAVKLDKNQTDLCLIAMSDNCGYTYLKVKLPIE